MQNIWSFNIGTGSFGEGMKQVFLSVVLLLVTPLAAFGDWPQFHGVSGDGTAEGALPLTWGDEQNIVWKQTLPGLGASSPVIAGGKLFLTSATGGASDLVRHVLCLDPKTGKTIWDKTVESVLPEQERIREDHGYASATAAADSTHVYVFFGSSGVFCFDHSGKQVWNTKVGSSLNGWGSAASLALHGQHVLVNASVESESLLALDKSTGKEVWKAAGIKESWHKPVVAQRPGGGAEIIMALAGEVQSIDAANGQQLWRCKSGIGWYMCPQPLVKAGVAYFVGGRSGVGGLAVTLGGSGDVTASHRLWTLEKGTNVPSPVIAGDHLYFAHENRATIHCVSLKTGDIISTGQLEPNPQQIYSSPILVGGKILWVGRGGQSVITAASPEFKILSSAVLENGRGVFNASPVLHGGHLYLRSAKFLYCIGGT